MPGETQARDVRQYPVNTGVLVEPVPLRETICGLPGESSDTESSPLTPPEPPGVKVTLIVHEPPGTRPGRQRSVSAKLEVVATREMFSVPLPKLVSLNFNAGLVVPTSWMPKGKLLTDNVALGSAVTPVPPNDRE